MNIPPHLTKKAEHCFKHYESVYEHQLKKFGKSQAMDESLQHFLDQRPSSKGLTAKDRAEGLATASFWRDSETIANSEYAALALSTLICHENSISHELLDHLALSCPDTLRWAIRYSKLFTRPESTLWQYLRQQRQAEEEWRVFFGVCDCLLEQLKPFNQIIGLSEKKLAHLSLVELLSYLSIKAYEHLANDEPADLMAKRWDAYNRIITRRLQTCTDQDFNLSERQLGLSLRQHLSPILFPSPAITQECRDNLDACSLLITATQELMDYEDSINWFCFDSECRYQFKPGESVIYNESDRGEKDWARTNRKCRALWYYWMNKGQIEFASLGMHTSQIGSTENNELNSWAFIKALRSRLVLNEIYGLGEEITLPTGAKIDVFQALLASELTSAFFQKDYIIAFQDIFSTYGSTHEALSKLAFNGLTQDENRFPMTWATKEDKANRIIGWTVSNEHPKGNLTTAKSILDFWTADLKAISNGMKENSTMPVPRLSERPLQKIGNYLFQFPWVMAKQNNLTASVNNLRRIGTRRQDLRDETQRIESRLGEQFRLRGFSVEIGYQPHRIEHEEDAGEIDLICHLDGVFLLIEVKSGYIRAKKDEIWLHRNKTLRKAGWQLQRKSKAVLDALANDANLRSRLGITDLASPPTLHAWIVDSSIELDEKRINGFIVVSLEALHVILRDERMLLHAPDQIDALDHTSLFPNGFSADRLVEIVENGEVWKYLEQN